MALPLARQVRSVQPTLTDIGLLILRIAFGGMLLVGHGWGKLQAYPGNAETFGDPIGLGSHMSVLGAIFAEVVCSALVIIGLATRLAALVHVFMFSVAAFIVHQNDPLFMGGGAAKEPALLYLFAFLALVFLGPGRVSIDYLLAGKPVRVEKY
jgi:putative oxidoreductase